MGRYARVGYWVGLAGLVLQLACSVSAVPAGAGQTEVTVVESPSDGGDTSCSEEYTTAELAAQAVELGNAARIDNGVPALTVSAVLTAVAEDYAERMALEGFTGHEDPEGNSVRERVEAAGYDWIAVAENLAYGPCTAERAIEGWLNSEGHRANLLSPLLTETGMGVYRGGPERMYWVHVFADPR
jgi:uncharacterized protein YkwD